MRILVWKNSELILQKNVVSQVTSKMLKYIQGSRILRIPRLRNEFCWGGWFFRVLTFK